jgi:hypothetical protein
MKETNYTKGRQGGNKAIAGEGAAAPVFWQWHVDWRFGPARASPVNFS